MHLLYYIASSDEVSFHIQLRQSRPIGIFLNGFLKSGICQNIHIFPILDSVELDHLHHVIAESASGHGFSALHKEHYIIGLDQFPNLFVDITPLLFFLVGLLLFRLEIFVTLSLHFGISGSEIAGGYHWHAG